MQFQLPVEKFNESVRDGSVGAKLGRVLEEIKPEAAYFTAKDGTRGGIMVVNLKDTTDMVRFAEPLFLLFNATVEYLPAMTPEEIQRSGVDQMGKKWQ
jgi:hypothetical protein